MSDFLATPDFIRHLLDVCVAARGRSADSKYALDKEQGRELVRWAVRTCRNLCRLEGLDARQVDDRLFDAKFFRGNV